MKNTPGLSIWIVLNLYIALGNRHFNAITSSNSGAQSLFSIFLGLLTMSFGCQCTDSVQIVHCIFILWLLNYIIYRFTISNSFLQRSLGLYMLYHLKMVSSACYFLIWIPFFFSLSLPPSTFYIRF